MSTAQVGGLRPSGLLLALDELRRLGGSESLSECREQIDLVDDALLLLLRKRMELAKEAGCIKRMAAKPLRDEARERQVIRRLSSAGLLAPKAVSRIWKPLIEQSLEEQRW
ncbi:MAG: chorismate mutase [Acidobacteriota bacterium]